MSSQTGKNIVVAYRVEATTNVAPGTASGKQLRLTPSPGLQLTKATIQSQEIRSDGLTSMARHGSQTVDGSFSGELSVGSFDEILEAIVRATSVAASTVTQATASLASITFQTLTITATSTSVGSGFLEAGIRVGDVFRVSGTGGANDGVQAMVKAVATHLLTVHGSSVFTADGSAVTSFALTRGKKLKNGTTPTRRSFYVDQYYQDIDQSQVFGGVRWTGFTIRGSPDGMATIELAAIGMSSDVLATGSSPYYVSPTQFTSDPLTFADAVIVLKGSTIAAATSFELSYQLNAAPLPVIGSDSVPDVFDNEARLTGSITLLREDLTRLDSYIDEDEVELHILLTEPEDSPADYVSLFVPRLKFMTETAPLGDDGGMVETVQWEAGPKATATGYDSGTLLTILTSAT